MFTDAKATSYSGTAPVDHKANGNSPTAQRLSKSVESNKWVQTALSNSKTPLAFHPRTLLRGYHEIKLTANW
jgi:hypothetical protein